MRGKTVHQRPTNRPPGFSLIEVLVTLVIIAIVAAISAPAILSMAPNMALKSAAQELHATLMEAKIQAIKENRNITVRVSDTDYYLDEDGDSVWDNEDVNNNGILDAGEDTNGNGILDKEKRVVFDNDPRKGVERFTPTGADKNWADAAIVQAGTFTFNTRGLSGPGSGTIYLVNSFVNTEYADLKNDNEIVTGYAITVLTSGAVKTRKHTGTLPFSKDNWK